MFFENMDEMWSCNEVVRAMYKYEEPNGLTFDIGEKICIVEKGNDGWWKGVIIENGVENQERSGWFPATFVVADNSTDANEDKSTEEVNGNSESISDDWGTAFSEDGKMYYYNKLTHETSWSAPAAKLSAVEETDDLPAPPDSMMESLIASVPPMPSVSPPSPPHSPTATSALTTTASNGISELGTSPSASSPIRSPSVSSTNRNSMVSSASAEELRAHTFERSTRKATLSSSKGTKKGSSPSSLPSSLHASNDSLAKLSSDSPLTNRRQRKSKASQLKASYFTLPRTEQANEQPLINSIEVSYCDHFWDDDSEGTGFEVVLSNIHKGKLMCREMAEFFRERALLEDLYARNLARLSKSNLGEQERGTLSYAWHSVKKSLEEEAQSRQQFAAQLLHELERPLLEYSEGTIERKKHLKKLDAMIQEDRKAVSSRYKEVDKARVSLYERRKTVEAMRTGGSSMKSSEYAKAQKKANTAAEDMRRMVESYNQGQSKWIEDMILALLELEKIESERIEFVKKRLNGFISYQEGAMANSAKTFDKLSEYVNDIDDIKDRQDFIERCGTGVVRPVDYKL